MKRLLLLTVLLVLVLPTAARAANVGPTILIRNESRNISDAALQNAIPALQAQLDQDFSPWWGLDARVAMSPAPPADAWVMNVTDDSSQNALGYHTVCHTDGHGVPCGYTLAAMDVQNGQSITVTLDHELLEMLADPFTTTMQKVGTRFYIQEVCDAPESEMYSYDRPGADGSPIKLSDFVYPSWFRPGHVGPFDHSGAIAKPLQLLPGGYISWWQNGKWQQAFKRTHQTVAGVGRE